MNVRIGEKDYKLEFTFEAVLHEDCVEKVIKLFSGLAMANEISNGKKVPEGEIIKEALKEMVSIPRTVITLFYAGLLEHNPVDTEDDAKALLKQYFKENPDSEDANFNGMMTAIMSQMENDGFFKQIGLANEEQDQPMGPQDHKKKVTRRKPTEV